LGIETKEDFTLKTNVTIYSRPGCHLCDEAKARIRQANCGDLYILSEVSIESDPELLERYKNDIPVITFDGVEVFRHRISAIEFKEALLRHRQAFR